MRQPQLTLRRGARIFSRQRSHQRAGRLLVVATPPSGGQAAQNPPDCATPGPDPPLDTDRRQSPNLMHCRGSLYARVPGMADHREVVIRSWRTSPDGLICDETIANPPVDGAFVSDALMTPVLSAINSSRSVYVDEYMDEGAAQAKYGYRWRDHLQKGGRVRWRLTGDGDWKLEHDPS